MWNNDNYIIKEKYLYNLLIIYNYCKNAGISISYNIAGQLKMEEATSYGTKIFTTVAECSVQFSYKYTMWSQVTNVFSTAKQLHTNPVPSSTDLIGHNSLKLYT